MHVDKLPTIYTKNNPKIPLYLVHFLPTHAIIKEINPNKFIALMYLRLQSFNSNDILMYDIQKIES